MNVIRILISELIGMFIDDGSLAAFSLILVIAVAGAVKLLALPPLIGGLLLLLGCLAILVHSVRRAVKR
ncbi:hypothetical protein QA646_11335 [Rhizobium sp. CB3090]|uniref:hypothetical protein n=1 Tax=Rhizobium sp. CB3090 TaxID=3039156 RepID=UPI0024B0487B|nr:hypothetical protein [Rhizobium sp. CB3090]WFU07911.1 hypothetical protein QA646_11335 [Rhizobium sp. CB3090]